MHVPRFQSTVVTIALLLALVPNLTADERDDRERARRIAHLIELLASKNQAPSIHGDAGRGEDQTIVFPKEYDRSAQVPVYLAVKELLAEDDAMDLLLAHEGDDRYSFSINAHKNDNVTVSRACKWIAEQKLLAFEPELHVITRSQFGIYPPGRNGFTKDWWIKNRQRGMAALQVEAIDASAKFMAAVDGASALPWHAAAAPLTENDFQRRRKANLQILAAIRQIIVTTGAPYRAKSLDDAHRCIFGLPWTGRRHNN